LAKSIKLNSSIDVPLLILGIVTPENILKLTWGINHLLNIRLSQSTGLKIRNVKTSQIHEFSLFQFEDENKHLKYSLLENRTKAGFYFNELRNIDHLFFIRGEIDNKFIESVIQVLKNSDEISAVMNINPGNPKLKGKMEHF
jgi:hypothetical protein